MDRFTMKDSTYYEKAMQRLQELENKIESGQLLEPPCGIGDTLYYVGTPMQIKLMTFIVKHIELKICDGEICWFVFDEDGLGRPYGDINDGGVIWYVGKDKNIAEARLKELKEKNE